MLQVGNIKPAEANNYLEQQYTFRNF